MIKIDVKMMDGKFIAAFVVLLVLIIVYSLFGSPGPVCYRDSSTSKYSGQECMPGYALKEKFKRGGYQTYWGCGTNYYRKQHQRRYVSGNRCESICIKTDKCGELK